MFKLYLESTLLKYLFIIYLIFFFSFFIRAESNQNIGKLNLPDGFEISIFAEELESPRQITETDEGYVIVGSKKGDKIFALFDGDYDGYAETKIAIAEGLKNPTGVTYHKGDLYFAEVEDIWIIKNIDDWILSDKTELPPVESYLSGLPSETWHGFRHLRFGPDENLYIPIGVPCNVCIEPQTSDKRFAAIHRYENGELVMIADGVRNSVGIDWHPITKKLYLKYANEHLNSNQIDVIDEEKLLS